MTRSDPHSFADDTQPSVRHFELDLKVDFETRSLVGQAILHLDRKADGHLDLDTRDLDIEGVTDSDGNALPFVLHDLHDILGHRLVIETNTDVVCVRYRTREASALQWLTPEQTAGKKHPYVFTQCQAIHARSVMPCQDTPRVRSTYDCKLRVPGQLTAVMAARPGTRSDDGDHAVFSFDMPQPIPSYLFAFAVGELESKELGPRSAVWAEPSELEGAAWEFAQVDAMLTKAEELFGEYPWERFDLLLMPPSFPYGGMENPRLTFLTPTLIAKDRSLVNVVAHELAHSWTGNLVTNANAEHFWLNEGFTVYAERRIIEALEGAEAGAIHSVLGRQGLEEDINRLSKRDPALTKLRTHLADTDPDEVYSQVPYEKGYLFLVAIERAVGRPAFDKFLKTYLGKFAFKSITTEDFVAVLNEELPEAKSLNLEEWLHGTGLMTEAPTFESESLSKAEALSAKLSADEEPSKTDFDALDTNSWLVVLNLLPKNMPQSRLRWIDGHFGFSKSSNAELRCAYLERAALAGDEAAWPDIADMLNSVGRMKYLRPLFSGLLESGAAGQKEARRIAELTMASYHPVAQSLVRGLTKV